MDWKMDHIAIAKNVLDPMTGKKRYIVRVTYARIRISGGKEIRTVCENWSVAEYAANKLSL